MAAISTGNAKITISAVTVIAHVKTGIRSIVMLGARLRRTVLRRHAPHSSSPAVASATPRIHRSIPSPGELTAFDSGSKPPQVAAAAPLRVRKPAYIDSPPSAYSHQPASAERGPAIP